MGTYLRGLLGYLILLSRTRHVCSSFARDMWLNSRHWLAGWADCPRCFFDLVHIHYDGCVWLPVTHRKRPLLFLPPRCDPDILIITGTFINRRAVCLSCFSGLCSGAVTLPIRRMANFIYILFPLSNLSKAFTCLFFSLTGCSLLAFSPLMAQQKIFADCETVERFHARVPRWCRIYLYFFNGLAQWPDAIIVSPF